jgi:acetyltransferase
MSIRNLDHLFRPSSIALIGASRRERSVGAVLARNLLGGGFTGPILPVNPHESAVAGVLAYPDIASLPLAPELAIIATPPATVANIIGELAARGCRAAVVVSAGFGEGEDQSGHARTQAMLDAARPSTFRIIGPNCLGIMVPHRGIQATFAHLAPPPGSIACLTQSGAIATSLVDWAAARSIGFSHLVSLGDMADVDFGDMLDYLALDGETRSIILYVEGITHARKFMSAARAAARLKPVVVIKGGRHGAAAHAALSHTGALAGSDAVYDAAFRRAGMLRVRDLDELFVAAETLARMKPMEGDRLAVLTNGGGLGVLATDDLLDAGGHLASLDPVTVQALDACLPRTWSRGNPVDIIGDAPAERYADALELLLADPNADAVLVLNCPTAVASSIEAADAVIAKMRSQAGNLRRNVITSWLGEHQAAEARSRFAAAAIPSFSTPGEAVRGFMHMVVFRRNQRTLIEAPASAAQRENPPDRDGAQALIDQARAEGRVWLDEYEAKRVLLAYGVPVVETEIARDPAEVERLASRFQGPVAIKIRSRDITHKSDVGGVALNLASPGDAGAAAHAMLKRVAQSRPDACIDGFTVQPMASRPSALELIVGINSDATFGPVVLFGQGGTGVEAIGDTALALPPLNYALALELIGRTRIRRQLEGYRGRPPADLAAIADTLIRVARLAGDLLAIAELDINPLLANDAGVVALDARIRLQDPTAALPLAILPYPSELERTITLRDGTPLFLRPIRPEDAEALRHAFAKMTPEDIHSRFFTTMKALPPEQLARLTQIDYDREMALLAFPKDRDGAISGEGIGIVRIIADPDLTHAEFAIAVLGSWQGRGVGYALMEAIMAHARMRGIATIFGTALASNARMLQLSRDLGFAISANPQDPAVVTVTRSLGS